MLTSVETFIIGRTTWTKLWGTRTATLEQNTVSCGHFGGNHERSELQLLEQSWNNFDTVVEQDLLTTQK